MTLYWDAMEKLFLMKMSLIALDWVVYRKMFGTVCHLLHTWGKWGDKGKILSELA